MKSTHFVLLAVAAFAGLQPHAKAQTFVNLGAASNFAVLAGSGITNNGANTISGDVGTFPTTTIGGGSFNFLTGANHAGDSSTQFAKTDLATAYANAAGQTTATIEPAAYDLGGRTLYPGIYSDSSSFAITVNPLILDAQGNPNAVWIFQAVSTLITSANISLINSAQAANVFWQVGSSATIGGTSFSGSVLAYSAITLGTGVMVDGRMLALNGAVTLAGDTITVPSAIPEPATTALIAAFGALGLAFWHRRRAAS